MIFPVSNADDGTLEYRSGRYSDGKWTVEENSELGVLTYDKSFEDVNASYWAHDVIQSISAPQRTEHGR